MKTWKSLVLLLVTASLLSSCLVQDSGRGRGRGHGNGHGHHGRGPGRW